MSEPIDWEMLRRHAAGAGSDAERERIARWIDEDPSRRRLVEGARRLLADPRALDQRFDASAAAERLRARIAPPPAHPSARARPIPFAAWRPAPPRRARAGVIAAAIAIVLGAAGAWLRGPLGAWWTAANAPRAWRAATTVRGQRAQLRLADGTHVTLGVESRLRYPGQFGAGERKVELTGEAYFEVAHDPRHPFVVRAGDATAKDLGTAFVVRAYPADAGVQVVVASGRVALRAARTTAPPARVLGAGELGAVDRAGRMVVRRVDPTVYLAWTRGRLEFENTPLRDVVAQLGRWYDADIVLADSALGDRRFTGAFSGEPLAQVLDAMTPPLHARWEHRGRTILLLPLPDAR